MKKSILGIAVACLAMAGCTKTQIVDVSQDRAIGFSPFVGKPTKTVTEVTTTSMGTGFYVFGKFDDGTSTWEGTAFNNEISTTAYYWEPDRTYAFGAYADGANGIIANAQFDPATKTLTFEGYTPGDSKDLVAAVIDAVDADTYISSKGPVSLNFKHLLSQVKLTFTTDAAEVYEMTITNVKINGAVSKATAEYNGTATWTGSANEGYSYSELLNSGVISSGVSSDQVKLVIPQQNTNNLEVTFKATLFNTNYSGEAEFVATLGHSISNLDANTWQPGYKYNYIANVPLAKVIDSPDDKVQIEFIPTVEDWEDAGNVDTAPTTPAP